MVFFQGSGEAGAVFQDLGVVDSFGRFPDVALTGFKYAIVIILRSQNLLVDIFFFLLLLIFHLNILIYFQRLRHRRYQRLLLIYRADLLDVELTHVLRDLRRWHHGTLTPV